MDAGLQRLIFMQLLVGTSDFRSERCHFDRGLNYAGAYCLVSSRPSHSDRRQIISESIGCRSVLCCRSCARPYINSSSAFPVLFPLHALPAFR